MNPHRSSPERGGGPAKPVEGSAPKSAIALQSVDLASTPPPCCAWSPSPCRGGLQEVRFAGYAAVFHHVDRGGDVIAPGAFAGARTVPLCWQHDPARPVGSIETLAEDARGLRVVARVTEPAVARELVAGRVTGLSIGYRALAHRPRDDPRHGPGRTLTRLELVEVSLVHQPMQPLARVLRVAER